MTKQTSKENTIGAALATIGVTSGTNGARKLTDAEKLAAAKLRASKVLHEELSDPQYAIALEICAVASEHKTTLTTWADRITHLVGNMYAETDRAMLMHATKGKAHVDAVGKALIALSGGSTWARTQYRAGVHRFLFGDDKTKKLPGARGVKTMAPADVARFVLGSGDKIIAYVKRINRKDVEAANLTAMVEGLKLVNEGIAAIRKACGVKASIKR
jgi:hypothetical protein